MKVALTLLCLTLLSACSTTQPIEKTVITKPVLVHQQVPEWMIKPVDKPVLKGNKYSDLIDLAIRYERSISQCNMQLSEINKLNPVNR